MGAPSAATTGLDGEHRGFLTDLVSSGRFCRDTRLGGMLHPGVVSMREVTDGDSLHVLVDGDDKMSVHVDRFSPVAGRTDDGCCEYSIRAVVAHVAAHFASQVRRLANGARGRHRCRLHCEQVDAGDETADATTTAGTSAAC